MTMPTTALVLACLACIVHARRKQIMAELMQGEDVQRLPYNSEAYGQLAPSPLESFTQFLLSVNPTAAVRKAGFHAASRIPTPVMNRPPRRAPPITKIWKVVLTETVEGFGQVGDVIDCKPTTFENHLAPNGLAEKATDEVIERYEKIAKEKKAEEAAEKEAAQIMSDAILAHFKTGAPIEMKAGPDGKLFGKLKKEDVVQVVSDAGFNVNNKDITQMPEVHEVGSVSAEIKLHKDVKFTLPILVIAEPVTK